MFRLSNDDDVPELRTLWRKCFDADRAFLDLFFGKGYGLTRTYVMETGDGIVSALSIFPVKYAGHRGGYVYGVCSHPEHRGHRHAVSLLRHAEEQLLDKDLDFMILRPASHSLFEYYRQQGYDTTLYRSVKRVTLPLIPPEIILESLSDQTLYTARARQCRDGLLFESSRNMCGYLLSYTEYCNGKAFAMHGEATDSGYSLTPYWIKGIYPNSSTAIITTPAGNEKEAHMLCKTRLDLFSRKHPLFTFTME